jgi:hypothetical protein
MIQNHGHPELIELIILGLKKWWNNEYIPYEYDILDPTLHKAYRHQRRIGWNSFIEGYWAKEWHICQSQHLSQLNSQKSSLLWISRAQQQIWLIAWEMWDHRNNYLHNHGTTIHSYKMAALKSEIQQEWQTGINQSPPTYNHLFEGEINKRLSNTTNQQLMWLFSIWAAQDNEILIGQMCQRNPTILTIYDHWKGKNNND